MVDHRWFIEVVQDYDGTYYANMIRGGKPVVGLPEHVDYNALRDAIREKTGVVILKRKEMFFQQSGHKKYAYIDNTQERNDCRVTLQEITNGWRPQFETALTDPERKPSLEEQLKAAAARSSGYASGRETLRNKTLNICYAIPGYDMLSSGEKKELYDLVKKSIGLSQERDMSTEIER